MLKLSVIEFIARAIPEAFLLIFSVYVFSDTRMDKKRYLLSSLLMVIMIFIIRSLPISYGIHTILSIIAIMVLSYSINKIQIMKCVQSTIVTIIIQLICEATNIFIIQHIFKKNINYIFNNPNLKIMYGIPSLVLFMSIIILYYIKLLRRKELQYDQCRDYI